LSTIKASTGVVPSSRIIRIGHRARKSKNMGSNNSYLQITSEFKSNKMKVIKIQKTAAMAVTIAHLLVKSLRKQMKI